MLLEDGKGNCARDKMGRPVLVQVGMMHGNRYEHQLQALYTNRRVSEYIQPDRFPEVTLVMECQPRKGAIGTFRFPDENTKALINMQREHYPGGLNSKSHFCGIPSVAVWAFHLVKPFMPKEVFENIELRADFKHLPNYISKENMLVEWGGSFKFDFNEYIKWRAAEEGVSDLLVGLQPRRYDAKADAIDIAKIPITDLNRGLVDIYSRHCHLTCQKLVQYQPSVRKYGVLWKVGSGKGFSTVRWTKKMLFVGGPTGVAIYFDTLDTKNNTLKPVEVLSLAAIRVSAQQEENKSDNKAYRYRFQIKAPSRNLEFGCDSSAERDAWVSALLAEIKACQ